MLSWLRQLFTSRSALPETVVPLVRARYDAAQTTDDNRRHWAQADGLSARQANSPEVRKTIRERARYEVANNCYARGMAETLADLVIGRGARLQIVRPRGNSQLLAECQVVERLFSEWADEVELWPKLWTARVARVSDGEGCGLLRTNRRLESPVKLTIQPLETDHFTHGYRASWDPTEVDGVELNDAGEVVAYYVTPEHPSEDVLAMSEPVRVPAAAAYLWHRQQRAGQVRGVAEIHPALPLFAILRRFTLATLHAAEFAASVSGAVETDGPPTEEPEPWQRILTEMNAFLTLPQGAKLSQLKSEHPSTIFDGFRLAILCEAGRCMHLPRGLALLDSSQYNYSSGRLDRQGTDVFVAHDRQSVEVQVLRKITRAWFAEARLIDGFMPESFRVGTWPIKVRWLWPGLGHVDRQKEASGTQLDLAMHRTTLADECARDGRDWEEVLEQRAIELRRCRTLGLTPHAPADSGGYRDADSETEYAIR